VALSFGSLFAGVGGADLGLEAAGMVCSWQVENDPACQQVLEYHWPDVPRYGDICDVNGADLEPVDVIFYGFPCQDLSVAGQRAGLDGDRSVLFFEAMRIIREMREATDGKFPKWTIAENVVGLLNADKGDAMGRCLDTLAEAGALVSEWCVLDAQFLGVPQRRRRVFVASCFDPAIAEQCPDPIFAIAESSVGNPPQIDTPRQTPSTTAGASTERQSDDDGLICVSATPMQDGNRYQGQNGIGVGKPNAPMYSLTTIDEHAVAVEVVDPTAFVKSRRARSDTDYETWIEEAPAPTLNEFEYSDVRTTVAVVSGECYGFDSTFSAQSRVHDNLSPPVKVGSGLGISSPPAVMTPTLCVRRLTPLECERLQGWPDDHTRWRADGKEQKDSPRYKQIGNGVASPVAEWVGRRIIQAST